MKIVCRPTLRSNRDRGERPQAQSRRGSFCRVGQAIRTSTLLKAIVRNALCPPSTSLWGRVDIAPDQFGLFVFGGSKRLARWARDALVALGQLCERLLQWPPSSLALKVVLRHEPDIDAGAASGSQRASHDGENLDGGAAHLNGRRRRRIKR
jgi:hypothetical protein